MNALQPLCPDAPRLVPEARLPRSRFVPELHPHPRRSPDGSLFGLPEHVPGLPPDRWCQDRSYRLGIDLYHQGYLWESHEAFEACFFAATDPNHRKLLQALIQLAAAELQLHRGIGRGVRLLTRRVVQHLDAVSAARPADARLGGLDPAALSRAVQARFANALSETNDPLSTIGPPIALVTVWRDVAEDEPAASGDPDQSSA